MPPPGFVYVDDFLSEPEDRSIIAEVERLPFHEVRMHGVAARRTVIHFGFDYDYEGWSVRETDPPPPFLAELRDRAAIVANIDPLSLEQFLIARYPPGATIGWHRDAPMFGSPVIGISLGAAARMRFRRKIEDGFETDVQLLAPRSLYILSGAARTVWQHHIPAGKELRYSISMRTVIRRPSPSRPPLPARD
jgi:alkylated DNA repair protein (DNA oxidative demethylase)